MTEIIVALIAGGLSFAGVLVSNLMTGRATTAKIETGQAVMNEKIGELTREVRAHNDFARRVPVVEEQIKVINHRLEDIEKENALYHRKEA